MLVNLVLLVGDCSKNHVFVLVISEKSSELVPGNVDNYSVYLGTALWYFLVIKVWGQNLIDSVTKRCKI